MESSDTDYKPLDSESELTDSTNIYRKTNNGKNYKCEYENCGAFFNRRDAYDRHTFKHTGKVRV